jgi:hypothetical protein
VLTLRRRADMNIGEAMGTAMVKMLKADEEQKKN